MESKFAFYSNRSGRYEIWSIRPDGSGLQRVTEIPEEDLYYPIWSPDQTRMAATGDKYLFILDLSGYLPVKTFQKLPPLGNTGEAFEPSSWSPDGKWLSGSGVRSDGSYMDGIVIYSFESRKYEKLTDSKNQSMGRIGPVWLKDSRTLLFDSEDRMFLIDRISKKSSKIYSPPPSTIIAGLKLSNDNRTIFFPRPNPEADIWLMTMK